MINNQISYLFKINPHILISIIFLSALLHHINIVNAQDIQKFEKLNKELRTEFSKLLSVPVIGEASTTFALTDSDVTEGKSFSTWIKNLDSGKVYCKEVFREYGEAQMNVDIKVP